MENSLIDSRVSNLIMQDNSDLEGVKGSGIILIATEDILSKFISLVTNSKYTTVGIYQPTSIYLYDTWRNSMPSWVKYFTANRNYLDLEVVLSCTLIKQVKLFPLKDIDITRFGIYLTKMLSEEKEETVDYECLFRNSLNHNYTGYDLVNNIFNLMSGKAETRGSQKLLNSDYLTSTIKHTFVSQADTTEINHSLFQHQLDKVISTFKQLYLNSVDFQQDLLNLRNSQRFFRYLELEEQIRKACRQGIVRSDLLDNINQLRQQAGYNLVNQEDYHSDKRIEISKELKLISEYFLTIFRQIKSGELVVIQLDKLLIHHNNMCQLLMLETLNIPDFLSITAVLTTDQTVEISHNDKFITFQANQLSKFSMEELKELLKTINSIRAFDVKYVAIQNSILKELYSRS